MPKITLPRGGDARQLVKVQALARRYLDAHGLRDWKVEWGRSKVDAGTCDYSVPALRFSAPLMSVWTMAQCEDTVLHELAHALVGPGKGHGPEWKAKCRELGIKPVRTWGGDGERVVSKYVGKCPNGHETPRNRRPKGHLSCAKCSKRFDERYLLTWYERR
jgi:SprT protein